MYCSAVLAVLVLVPADGKMGSLTVHRIAEGPHVVMVSLHRVGASDAEPQLVRTRELLNPAPQEPLGPSTHFMSRSVLSKLLNPAPQAPLGSTAGAAIGAATGRPILDGAPKPRDRSWVTWKNLPEGTYDIGFEAKGYTKSVKRVRVSHDDGDELEIWVELGAPVQKGKKDRVRK